MKIFNPELFKTRPNCVLFDLDNTFYAYDPAHKAGLAATAQFANQSLNLSVNDFSACFADARTELKARLGKTAASHSRLLYFQRTLELAGFGTQVALTLQMDQVYWRVFLQNAPLFEGAKEFLDDLRIAGTPTVFVTDQIAQIQFRKLIHFGLDQWVEWVVTSEEVGIDKPNARNFELALAKIGGVEGTVWMVGEECTSDIQGARNAIEAVCLQKVHDGVKVHTDGPAAPDATFTDFSEIRKLFAKL